MTPHANTGARASRIRPVIISGCCVSLLGLAMSCAPPAPGSPTAAPNPTLQASATEIGGAVRAVATAQGGIAQPTVAAAQTQVVSSGQSAATAAAPTLAAAGTTVAGAGATAQVQQATNVTVAREATATALAPTAQALATRVAPTVQAAATQVVTAAGTSVATSPVHVTNVSVGASDTLVTIQNTGSAPMSLAGWTLLMGPNLSVVLNDVTMKAGQTRQVHFSQGTDTDGDVYIGFGSSAARASLQPGARVVLIAPPDQIASVYSIT